MPSKITFPIRLLLLFLCLSLLSCQSPSTLVKERWFTPTPPPDPFIHYRAILQPWAQTDIEANSPLPAYHITAKLDLKRTTLNGVMRLVVPNAGSELVFRLYPNLEHYAGSLAVTHAQIDGQTVAFSYLANNTALRLPIPPTAGRPLTVTLTFITQLRKTSLLEGGYTLFGWAGDILSLPGFYPVLAVRQGEEWVIDQPPLHADVLFNEVALYQLDLALPQNLIVTGSGVVLNVINNSDGSRTWQLAGGPLRDMTVVAGPFQAISDTAAGAGVTSYYLPGHEAAAQLALSHATASLRLYSDTYGPYPYTELDLVEAPLNVRGMEYSGLVLIGTELYDGQREFLTFLVAHEINHQWWYALVGNNPYRHPWLDEGLAEYGAFDYYRSVFGEAEAQELLTGRWNIPFSEAASGGVDGVVDQPADAFDPVMYELLVYSKAALFFHTLRTQLGDDLYHKILQTYYTENRYRIATPQTFLATAQRVSGQDLAPLAEEWLRSGD